MSTLDGDSLQVLTFTGFDYPNNAVITPILGDGTTPGFNAVMQQRANAFRIAQLTAFVAGASAVGAIRTLYESKEEVVFVDHLSNSYNVVVFEFAAPIITGRGGDDYQVALTLVETSAFEAP